LGGACVGGLQPRGAGDTSNIGANPNSVAYTIETHSGIAYTIETQSGT
jgi:hypothetical protein